MANFVVTPGSPVAPSLISTKLELEKQFHEIELGRKITKRPTIDAVETKLGDKRQIALMICPGVKSIIKNYEQQKKE